MITTGIVMYCKSINIKPTSFNFIFSVLEIMPWKLSCGIKIVATAIIQNQNGIPIKPGPLTPCSKGKGRTTCIAGSFIRPI